MDADAECFIAYGVWCMGPVFEMHVFTCLSHDLDEGSREEERRR